MFVTCFVKIIVEEIVITTLVILGLLLYGAHWANKQSKKQEQLNVDFRRRLNRLIERNRLALARQRKIKVTKDEYGGDKTWVWAKEKEYFFYNILLKDPEFDKLFKQRYPNERIREYSAKNSLLAIIERVAQENLAEVSFLAGTGGSYQGIEKLSPIEFEYYCADILSHAGWNATVTQASGDQGVDVIAERQGIRLVVQCKKYSSPVGNKAVQEIAAGRIHQQARSSSLRADHAVVVTNNGFTPSARELANTTNVKLLHLSELETFAKELM
jgi:HJR/Mrr/RecB family endonuclease